MAQRQVDEISSVPASESLTSRRLADWWDTWKIRLRQILLATTKQERQGLTKGYRQRLHHLYVRLGAALLEARSSDDSPVSAQRGCDHPGPVEIRRNFVKKSRSVVVYGRGPRRSERWCITLTFRARHHDAFTPGWRLIFRTTLSCVWVAKLSSGRIGHRNLMMKWQMAGN
uniref:Uncharacterized protein n=1 Tax=Hyaloperonospora arabidopsidis (strain Emoy2) TaxID=559515 RepID=M4BIX7_HYAAE